MLKLDDIKVFYICYQLICKSIDTLCIMIAEILKMNPADGNLFLFRSKSGGKLKAIYYETNCFTLWYRWLEKGKFVFPKVADGTIEITQEHFHWLLASDKFSRLESMRPINMQIFVKNIDEKSVFGIMHP